MTHTTIVQRLATLTATDQDGNDKANEIRSFAEHLDLDGRVPGRYSLLLFFDLYLLMKSGRGNPFTVLEEIDALEGRGRPSQHKPPIQNKHQPLKNLWHKHYQQSDLASMALNVKRALSKYGIPFVQHKIDEAAAAGEERYIAIEHVNDIANDAISGNLGRLRQEQALTGEWLMFAEYQGQRFYLCLATHHKNTHEHIREQIDRVCAVEFPFLTTILEPWSPSQ
ncbi:TPA: hypothetical protein QDB15_005676 [Burkholderia vietnamiensis]|uniref:hypothetical protein n=1 Tax=Burkholderia vietnamiensis TaxID=60552 RepID=UPI00075BE067|nr:hypothetical protein [Burkholderia vietnamiensis]KVS01298.1 hypothetical protein WK32_17455 [Burkholderia vietnamiensis]MBR8161643.1 hypothetical protein [Burkholderia vietnamiensis]MCA7946730.1 hypothetical protein [Burkholderia vietnamiensis]MCA8211574.1 hypothetical protein [Burkholderia vietnamiensis]MDN7413066.1 hypothetical protein [Burkholderia vietnamiensis]